MKKFWKALGLTALAAAVPVRVRKDEVTGRKSIQSLLISVDIGPGKDDAHTDIGINLGEGVLTDAARKVLGKKEKQLFADDDPAANGGIIDFAQAAAEARAAAADARDAADEAQDAADEAVLAAEEAESIADELEAAAVESQLDEDEVTEEDFDPEV